MDKEYIVTITEVLQRKVPVKAPNKEEAEYIVEQQYYNQEHILNENDLTAQSFKAKAA
ncbi:MAG: DpnD/PcfM family protein [Clostridia bacterium]|nr:DpnD/PcfM family protein [Clostridia bacterium]